MKEIMFNNETVKVLEATGYNDGYYWDMNAVIEFRGEKYSVCDIGSGSGYIDCFSGITKEPFERLYGEEQGYVDEDEWDYFEGTIIMLLSNFIESGAKISWEFRDDYCNTEELVDGLKQKNEENEEET